MQQYYYQRSANFLFYFIPSLMFLVLWLFYMTLSERFFLMAQHWQLTLTMAFGSFIAGATSEGGGAVAFPVFTKLLQIPPQIARTFSLAIQMVGMGTASLVIFKYKIPVVKRAIIFSSLGGGIGLWLGTIYLSPLLKPAYFKIAFTVLTLAFGFVLFIENKKILYTRYNDLKNPGLSHNLVLFFTGIFGGMFSSIVGTGIDFLTFSVLVLYYNVSEKVATPTSVVLMAINSTIGFSIHHFYLDTFMGATFDYWLVCVPIVIFGAPLGAIVCSKISRENIIRFLLFLIMVEFVSTIAIVKFDLASKIVTPLFFTLLVMIFYLMNRLRLNRLDEEHARTHKSQPEPGV